VMAAASDGCATGARPLEGVPPLSATRGPAVASRPAVLSVRGVTKRFGGLVAVDQVSFDVAAGRVKGIIGPNGAGKTTVFNLVTGVLRPDAGDIVFAGTSLVGLPTHRIARMGLARTFQNVRIFSTMSVIENVVVGFHYTLPGGAIRGFLPERQRDRQEVFGRAMALLDRVGLAHRAGDEAQNLPIGSLRLLELCRALAAAPRVILLDEPASGLNAAEKGNLARHIMGLKHEGQTFVIVEHDVNFLMVLADDVMVLDFGRKIADDAPGAVQRDQKVIDVFLGGTVDLARR
jgi:branched-chain amino acid transport system ATP-binding protein